MNNFTEYVMSLDRPLIPPTEPKPDTDTEPAIQESTAVNTFRDNEMEPNPIVAVVQDKLNHPFQTAAEVAGFHPAVGGSLGLLKGIPAFAALDKAGEMMDEGYGYMLPTATHFVQNPADINHAVRGLGMEIKELPSKAAEHGRSLWNTMTKDLKQAVPKSYEQYSQDDFNNLYKTFEPMRP